MAEVVWRGIIVPYEFDDGADWFRANHPKTWAIEPLMAQLAVCSPLDFAEEWPDEPSDLANLVRLVKAHYGEVLEACREEATERMEDYFADPD